MDADWLYDRWHNTFEDFWSRRTTGAEHTRAFAIGGRRVELASNDAGVLAAADVCAPQYSEAPPAADPPLAIRIVVLPAPRPPGPAPDDLIQQITYAAAGPVLALQLGAWGHAQIDLEHGRALAVLGPELAGRPELVAQALLNTLLTNWLIARGLGLLHATCVVRDRVALLLMAPHNTGKSTTALHLALAGYALLTDSMVYVDPCPEGPRLLGFPVGRVRLRADRLDQFPRLASVLRRENVRAETKFALDLRAVDPALVCSTAVTPGAVHLALLGRRAGAATRVTAATRETIVAAVMANSLYADERAVWRRNLAALEPLVERASWHAIAIGSEPAGIVDAVAGLLQAP